MKSITQVEMKHKNKQENLKVINTKAFLTKTDWGQGVEKLHPAELGNGPALH